MLRADMAPIAIGEKTNIHDLTMAHMDEGAPCIIGHRVGVGHWVVLHGCQMRMIV